MLEQAKQDSQFHQLMRKSTTALQVRDYEAAYICLQACVCISEVDLRTKLCAERAEDYCTAVILLAATELKLAHDDQACGHFADALHLLHTLYQLQHTEADKALIRRFETILIRAQQTACTLSRLSHSLGERHEADLSTSIPH